MIVFCAKLQCEISVQFSFRSENPTVGYYSFILIFAGVIWQTALMNQYRLVQISRKDQFVMSYGGIRGAIAFSLVALLCADLVPSKKIMFTTTVVVVMFTMFIQVRVLEAEDNARAKNRKTGRVWRDVLQIWVSFLVFILCSFKNQLWIYRIMCTKLLIG